MSTPASDRTTRRRARVVRLTGMLVVLAVSTVIGLLHVHKVSAWLPVNVDALCPFGGIETLWSFLATGAVLKRVAVSSIILLAGTVAVALVAGRAFCGQICPLGTLQELFGMLGRKLFRKRLTMPVVLDRPARYLKYLVLVGATLWTWAAADLVIRAYDPWATYHHLTSSELLADFSIGLVVLGITLAGSLAYDRFFCKYACPMGAFLAVFNKVSWLHVRRDADVCVDCGACDKACPANIRVASSDVVRSAECLSCSECVNACPAPGALTIAPPSGRTVSPMRLTAITLAVFLGLVLATSVIGWFDWTQPTFAGEAREAVEQGGAIDTSAIKGSTSMQEVSEATGIPGEELRSQFGLTEAEMELPLKDVKATYGFTMEDVRAWVDARLASGQ